MTKMSISKGAQIIGYNLVAFADFKGIGKIRTGLKLLRIFEKDIPKGDKMSEEELNKKVDLEIDLDMAKEMKDIIDKQEGIKGMNSKLIVELYDALEYIQFN